MDQELENKVLLEVLVDEPATVTAAAVEDILAPADDEQEPNVTVETNKDWNVDPAFLEPPPPIADDEVDLEGAATPADEALLDDDEQEPHVTVETNKDWNIDLTFVEPPAAVVEIVDETGDDGVVEEKPAPEDEIIVILNDADDEEDEAAKEGEQQGEDEKSCDVARRLGLAEDIELEYSDDDFDNLTDLSSYSAHIRPLLAAEIDPPSLVLSDSNMNLLLEAKFREFQKLDRSAAFHRDDDDDDDDDDVAGGAVSKKRKRAVRRRIESSDDEDEQQNVEVVVGNAGDAALRRLEQEEAQNREE